MPRRPAVSRPYFNAFDWNAQLVPSELGHLSLCPFCSAFVWSAEKHYDWHVKCVGDIEKQAPQP